MVTIMSGGYKGETSGSGWLGGWLSVGKRVAGFPSLHTPPFLPAELPSFHGAEERWVVGWPEAVGVEVEEGRVKRELGNIEGGL